MESRASHHGGLSYKEFLWATAALTVVYLVVRLPLLAHPLIYYDDGQSLYHTMALLRGLVPYRDHTNHHFMGYLIPYLLTAKVIGLSLHLVTVVQLLSQAATGAGLYLCARRFCGPVPALVATLLVVTAREPWVLGFQPFYQTNVLMVWIWYLALRIARDGDEGTVRWSAAAGFLCGLALISDQRTLLFGLPPLAAAVWTAPLRPGRAALRVSVLGGAFAAPILGAILYLVANGAWESFVEQTLVFPTRFRSGSGGMVDAVTLGVWIHRHLPLRTPVLFLFGLAGAVRAAQRLREPEMRVAAAALLSVSPIGFLGGRDYDYYTIPHLAVLGLLASLALGAAAPRIRRTLLGLAAASIVFTVVTAVRLDAALKDDPPPDVVQEFVTAVRPLIAPDDTLLVWGYRLDLYVRLGMLAPIRSASNFLFHPDPFVEGHDDRLRHIFPKYEVEFLDFLRNRPPTWIVMFTQIPPGRMYSPAEEALKAALAANYEPTTSVSGLNWAGQRVVFELFRRVRTEPETMHE